MEEKDMSQKEESTISKEGEDSGKRSYTEANARHIPQEEHLITLDMIDPDALFILKRLGKAGFSGYLVGGGVRDLFLGKKPKDFDISTDARPGQIRKLFPRSNTIGRRFRLVQVFFGSGKAIEVSTLRSLSEHDLDGPVAVLAPNNTFGTLSEDARRRDLTINSLFYEIENETIIDYVQGFDDLKQGIIRVVGDPERRFTHDPVRMMRAVRHAARNKFVIEEQTWQAIVKNAHKLELCPTSRLRDELLKDLYSGSVTSWFSKSLESGIFTTLLPIYSAPLKNEQALLTLTQIFQTIDRVNRQCVENKVHRQKDFFLVALMLIPWAEHNYQLYSTFRKGAQLFKYARIIREELDNTIGKSLNFRRSLRQEVTSLLINLAQLLYTRKPAGEGALATRDDWPKWLQRKSYFQKAFLFYQFYIEATTGEIVVFAREQEEGASYEQGAVEQTVEHDSEVLPATEESFENKEKSLSVNHKGGRSRAAFAPGTKGGVFGFRKE